MRSAFALWGRPTSRSALGRLLILANLCAWVAVVANAGASRGGARALKAHQAATPDRRAPDPQSTLGFEPCTDYRLASHEAIASYFRALAAAVPGRVRLVDIGRTVEGRSELMAIITSEKNMNRIDRYKDISRSLALARHRERSLSDEQARALAREGKAVVWIDFGLHSSEVAATQTAPLLAYRVASDDSPDLRNIRENVVFLLVPDMNPDGTTMVSDWYTRNVGTAWESRLPELWHTYAGHDNNRDWFMMTQPETRNAAYQLYEEWFPQIVYDQHQTSPYPSRIFIPPFDEPTNPNIHPLVMRGVDLVGGAMRQRLDREAKRGAIARLGFDAWWNGGMRTTPYFHNMIGILTETAHPSATPTVSEPRTFPRRFANGVSTETPSADYPTPFLGGGWQMRDSCDYMVTTSLAVLDVAARRRWEWLYGSYMMARQAVSAGRDETFLIPSDQWDPGTAVKLVNTLRLGGVQVERATAPFSAGGANYAPGTFIVRGAQPFGPYVRDLLTPQTYPDVRLYPGGPPKPPYDITGWTLSFQMGVRVDRIKTPVSVTTERVAVNAPREPRMSGYQGKAVAFDPRANDSFTAINRLLKSGEVVFRLPVPLELAATRWPAGAFVVDRGGENATRIDLATKSLGLEAAHLAERPTTAVRIRAPRIGVYHAWGGNIDEGWTRWVLEQFEFGYKRVHDAVVRAGDLAANFDVLVLPDATYRQMRDGFLPGSMPEQYTGGMSDRGVMNLRTFVEAGGTLVTLARAAELPVVGFGLPMQDVTAGQPLTEFRAPGAILTMSVDPTHPVGYGMPPTTPAFFGNSPVFAVAESKEAGTSRPRRVASYPATQMLLSGWMRGEPLLANRPAVLDLNVGRGRVILVGVRAQHRGQAHGTFKILFNSLYISALRASGLG